MQEPADDKCAQAKQLASSFEEIWNAEMSALESRRRCLFFNTPEPLSANSPADRAYSLNLFGVALSGGGIRSATLNLGILQALAQKGLLPYVDYLSSISGGGYIGTWLHSVIYRKNSRNPRLTHATLNRRIPGQPEDDPVAFLRKYSNYLAPKMGLFSADFWVIFTIWIRNMLLNLLILIPFLASLITAAVLLAPWAAAGLVHRPSWNNGLGGIVLFLLLVAVVSSSHNLRAISKRQFASSEEPKRRRRVPVSVTLTSVLLACFALFYCHWSQPLGDLTLAGIYCLGLLLLLSTMQTFGGFVTCFLGLHKNSKPLLVLHLIWMPLLATLVGTALFCGAFTLIGQAGVTHIAPVIWGPPLIVVVLMGTVSFHIGLMGADFFDASREWLARIGAILALVSAAWVAFLSLALYGPYWMAKLGLTYGSVALAMIVGWLGSTMFGVSAGTGAATGAKPGEPEKRGWKDSLVGLAPAVFMIGLLILISGAVHYSLGAFVTKNYTQPLIKVGVDAAKPAAASTSAQDVIRVKILYGNEGMLEAFNNWFAGLGPFVANYSAVLTNPATTVPALILLSTLVVIALFLPLRVNINEFSIHHFYKNRLVRCYLGAGNAKERRPNRFTGFDSEDDINLKDLHAQAKDPYLGPYAIVGTTLNLNAGSELAQQERKGASFIFSPLFCGFNPSHSAEDLKAVAEHGSRLECDGYIATETYFKRGGPRIGTAMAISGAAANPSWGYHTSPPVAFLLTFFNVRLGWWIGNPRIKPRSPALESFTPARRPGPMYGFLWLIMELLGQTTGGSKYINLSDGGHFENLGLYELVRRRCRYVIVGDGEQDEHLTFESLGGAIRKCRADFGVEIDIDVEPIRKADGGSHCVVGTITYPEIDSAPQASLLPGGERQTGKPARGWLVYFKASVTGDEPEDVKQYRASHSDFPHQTTLNQFFTESQFESYRRLGQHMVEKAFENIDTSAFENAQGELSTNYISLDPVFQALAAYWYPNSSATTASATAMANAYSSLLKVLALDADLSFLDAELIPGGAATNVTLTPAIERKVHFFILEVIQLMENVWFEFDLDSQMNRENPKNGGWMQTLRLWSSSKTVQKVWDPSRDNYNKLFQKFFEDLKN